MREARSRCSTQSGPGTVTARVPHPLQFNKPRTTTGEIADADRREFGQHIMVGWAIPASGGLDFMLFGRAVVLHDASSCS